MTENNTKNAISTAATAATATCSAAAAAAPDMARFAAFCARVNALCAAHQTGAKEFVTAEEASRAMAYAKDMPLRHAGDVLLFCAAINLMNTYVKQPGNKKTFGYGFKSLVPRLVEQLHRSPIDGVVSQTQMDKGSTVTMVVVCGTQFSFHCVKGARTWLDEGAEQLVFDGVRKQQCAGMLFKLAEDNRLLRTA